MHTHAERGRGREGHSMLMSTRARDYNYIMHCTEDPQRPGNVRLQSSSNKVLARSSRFSTPKQSGTPAPGAPVGTQERSNAREIRHAHTMFLYVLLWACQIALALDRSFALDRSCIPIQAPLVPSPLQYNNYYADKKYIPLTYATAGIQLNMNLT